MKSFPYLILGGGVAAGYALREFALQGGQKEELGLITAENVLPYDRPSLSKGFLSGAETLADFSIVDSKFVREHGIHVFHKFLATAVDFRRRVIHGTGGQRVGFGKLLIATGARVKKLDVPGGNLRGLFYLRSLDDSRAIRRVIGKGRKVVVVGGGFIGMETSAVCAKKGCLTTLVIPGKQLMEDLFPESLAQYFERYYRAKGVEIVPHEKVTGFAGRGRVNGVKLASGRILAADMAILGTGVSPATSLFEKSPLIRKDGIVVNPQMETSILNVWAAGDVAQFPDFISHRQNRIEHWDNAAWQGRVAMCNMMGKPLPFHHVPYFFSDMFDLSYQFWGDLTGHDSIVYRGNPAAGRVSVWWLRKRILIAALVLNRPDEESHLAAKWIFHGTALNPRKLGDPHCRLGDLHRDFGQ
ncbi:MAG TPA: FAD-dependent oxidoreductase [Candidatus Limnocylindria bacterium]|nr:FAD-dependent oxidoreductase [Candidatus Limnocylindria bacterium]